MNKTEYIIRQLSKTNKKSFENYVVTRIWHLLNDTNIKFVTQQYVKRPNGRALTDMYFPQINLHVEVDEAHHFDIHQKQINLDLIRDADIINATGNEPVRIKVCGNSRYDMNINDINNRIDVVVEIIRNKFNHPSIIQWDLESEFDPLTYIRKGFISADDDVSFRTIADACNCFGNNYVSVQRAFFRHPIEDRQLWFPKLYPNKDWDNELSLSEEVIHMRKIHNNDEFFEAQLTSTRQLKERLTFARVKSNLGDVMYRFKGVYKCDVDESNEKKHFIYKRVSKEAKTYSPL
jgi:very-short-patch-repair endonuclease